MGAESEATSDPSARSQPRSNTGDRRSGDAGAGGAGGVGATSGIRPSELSQSSGSYELVLSAVVFALIGLLIDRWLGTTPIFVLVFTVAGFIGAASSLYYRYKYRIAQIDAETAALRAAARDRGRP